jgi:hypothetical protein
MVVHPADDDDPAETRLAGFGEGAARVDRDAGVCVDDDGGGVDGPQRADRLTDEVRIARRVDDVEAFAGVFEVNQTRFDRILMLLLLLVEVANARPVIHAHGMRDRAGKRQKLIGQRRLTGGAVAAKGNVADVFDLGFGHGRSLAFCLGKWGRDSGFSTRAKQARSRTPSDACSALTLSTNHYSLSTTSTTYVS